MDTAVNTSNINLQIRGCIQKVATGPEYSKNLSLEDSQDAMRAILQGNADPVQTAILLIALRMKRETDEENRGVLRALIDAADITTAEADTVVDIADPYDGYGRGLPASPFLAPVLAACGLPAVAHGLDSVGPKYGITHRKVLKAAGFKVDRPPAEAAAQLAESGPGWTYVDQKAFCKPLHDLIPLRTIMVKRSVLTTVEVLLGPIRGRSKTHLITGFVHKAYPPIYASLAREAGFDSAAIIRGVEGGIIPSLQQPARVFEYHDKGEEAPFDLDPTLLGIEQDTRAVPLPADLPPAKPGDEIAITFDSDAAAAIAMERGVDALKGKNGPTRDSLVYAGAIVLYHLRRADSLMAAADQIRGVLESGEALSRFEAALG